MAGDKAPCLGPTHRKCTATVNLDCCSLSCMVYTCGQPFVLHRRREHLSQLRGRVSIRLFENPRLVPQQWDIGGHTTFGTNRAFKEKASSWSHPPGA